MEKKKRAACSMLLLIILGVNLASSSFILGENSDIKNSYFPGELLKGTINISFQDEPVDSIISGFDGKISLREFLDKNSISYKCNPKDCKEDYVFFNPNISKDFSLDYGKEKTFSLVLNGKVEEVNKLGFNILAGNQASCISPLEIDVLDDNSIEWKAGKASNDFSCLYDKGTGCFDSSSSLTEVSIGNVPYCEKIMLTSSGRFKIGAWVKKIGNASLTMSIYSLTGEQLASCSLDDATTSGDEISCIVNYSNKEIKEHYVCLNADRITDYKTKMESSGEKCGFYSIPGEEKEYNDYYIFAKGARFDSIGDFAIEGDLGEINEYISSRYENCSNGCSIPVKFKAYGNLNIKLENLSFGYSTTSGLISDNKFYDASTEKAKLSSGFSLLNLETSGISVPESYGNHSLMLAAGNKTVLSRNISVVNASMIKDIFPKIIAASVMTKFSISVSLPQERSITSYKWDFGDNKIEETEKNYAFHKYNIGAYNLTISIEDNTGFKTSKSFIITAEPPKKAADSTIQEYKKRIDNIMAQLDSFANWKNEIKKKIAVENLVSEINSLERKYNSAADEDEYARIMENLSKLEVPYAVKEISRGKIPFFVDYKDINQGYFAEYNQESEEGKERAIAGWTQKNLDMTLEFSKLASYSDNKIESLAVIFNLEIKARKSFDSNLYVIIENPNLLVKNAETKNFSGAVGIEIPGFEGTKNIEFLAFDELSISKKIYLSPEFSELVSEIISSCNYNDECEEGEDWRNCRNDCKPIGLSLTAVLVVVFIAILAYLAMKKWYRKNYENLLFKSKNEIYNIITFIKNSKSKGIDDRETARKLKKAGWKSEQVNYAFKKFRGESL